MDLKSSLPCQVPTACMNTRLHMNMIGKFFGKQSKLERGSLLAKVYWLQTVAGLVNRRLAYAQCDDY